MLTSSARITGPGDALVAGGGTITGNLIVTGNSTVQGTTMSVVNQTSSGTVGVTVASATALTVASSGTNYALQVDTSTASQVAGLKITGAITGGTVAIVAIDTGSNTNVTLDGKGSGTITIGGVSTGNVLVANGASSGNVLLANSAVTITRGGGIQIGSPTGADKGSGTLNTAGAIWTNGTQALNASGVIQVAGQTNITSVGTLTSLTMGGTLTMGANTLALASATISGTPTWSSNQAITLSTASQPNITSIGTLTSIATSGKMTTYNNVATAGWGVPSIYNSGRVTGQTATGITIGTYTVGASDGSFICSSNVLVTAAGGGTLAMTVTISYTDEGNTSRVLTVPFVLLAGTTVAAITFAQGAVPYEGIVQHLRCKASTSITIATAGTIGGATYNADGMITQIA